MVQVNVRVQPVLFLDFLRLSGDNIHKRRDTAPFRELKIRFDMGMGNPAGSNDGNLNHFSVSSQIVIP